MWCSNELQSTRSHFLPNQFCKRAHLKLDVWHIVRAARYVRYYGSRMGVIICSTFFFLWRAESSLMLQQFSRRVRATAACMRRRRPRHAAQRSGCACRGCCPCCWLAPAAGPPRRPVAAADQRSCASRRTSVPSLYVMGRGGAEPGFMARR
jgi:hypothetical protein